ncbi:MAG: hypothetical protein HXY20_14245 [Acidobacteria bacterium]|nr:hypothetical protein [Acidobacteriota bacterium]
MLTRYRHAAGGRRFPEHASSGLLPWQARKLYRRERGGPVAVPVGDSDPVLGRSYREIGAEGYSWHRSRGMGAAFAPPGGAHETYRLADSAFPGAPRESGFFDSVDTSLMSILELVAADQHVAHGVRPLLKKAQAAALEARRLFVPSNPENAAPAVTAGLASGRHRRG